MYQFALFLHLVGVAMLVIALSYTLGGLFRSQRAADVRGVRSALGFVPIAERLIPVAMIVILACGLYMVGKGSWGWGTGWVVVAIALFVLMSGLGMGVEGKRIGALLERVDEMPDGPVPPEVDAMRYDPVLTHVATFGASQIFAFLFLMADKPSAAGAIATVAIAGAISVPLARLALRSAARAQEAPLLAPERTPAAADTQLDVQV